MALESLRKSGGDKDSAPDGAASSPPLGINQVYYKRGLPSAAKARVKPNLTGVLNQEFDLRENDVCLLI